MGFALFFCPFSLRFDETSRDFVLCRAQLMFLKPNRFTSIHNKNKIPERVKSETERKFVKTKEIEEVQVWRPPDENRIFGGRGGGNFRSLVKLGWQNFQTSLWKKRSSHCP
jgi:hypothetical protein